MQLLEIMRASVVIPVIALDDIDHAVPLARALVAGGIRVLEVTLRTAHGLPAIRAICSTWSATFAAVTCGIGFAASHATSGAGALGPYTSVASPCALPKSDRLRSHARHSSETKAGYTLTITTPPAWPIRASKSSGMLRGTSATARAPECDAMTGALVMSSTAAIVASDTWLTSTIMPMRFISATTDRPKSVSPLARGASVDESAQLRLLPCVSVI